jgi:hypothetical protein
MDMSIAVVKSIQLFIEYVTNTKNTAELNNVLSKVTKQVWMEN